MEIQVIKLVSGEEFVATFAGEDMGSTKVKFTKPLALQPFPNGAMGFADFMTPAVTDRFELDRAHIMLQLPATEDCAAQYKEIQEELSKPQSDLVVPEKPSIEV